MTSRKRARHTTEDPRTTGAKKVAAPLRQLPGGLMEKASRVSGVRVEADVATLVRELGPMIDATRRQVSVTANAALVTLYWQIGHRVRS